jgi:hypothetical protein
MAFGVGLLRYIRNTKKKPKIVALTLERIVEGPLVLLEEKGHGISERRVWVILTNQHLCWGTDTESTPEQTVFFSDIVGVHTNGMEHEASHRNPSDSSRYLVSASFRTGTQPTERDMVAQETVGNQEFIISTYERGFFQGRPIVFRAIDRHERDIWWRTCLRVLKLWDHLHIESEKELPTYNWLSRLRRKVKRIYLSDRCQMFTASLVSMHTYTQY